MVGNTIVGIELFYVIKLTRLWILAIIILTEVFRELEPGQVYIKIIIEQTFKLDVH